LKLNNKGETFIESLVALLILSMVVMGFMAVLDGTGKLTEQVKKTRIVYDSNRDMELSESDVKVSGGDLSEAREYTGIKLHTDGEYYYYEF